MGVRPRAALVNCICVRGNSVEDASWRAHSSCSIDTRVDVRPTPRRVPAQQTESPRHVPGGTLHHGRRNMAELCK
jgi:hypothetical protein